MVRALSVHAGFNMSKFTGPILKRYRRLGEDFALRGDRSLAEKYKKSQKKTPPGIHGRKSSMRKLTQYGLQLLEKQKAKFFYMLNERQLKNYYQKASQFSGSTSDKLVEMLELRLDNLIYRSGAVDSHKAARQLVSHGHVLVDGRRVTVASYPVKFKSVISFGKATSQQQAMIKAGLSRGLAPGFLAVNKEKLTIELLRAPLREEVDAPIDEKFIIEFYSR